MARGDVRGAGLTPSTSSTGGAGRAHGLIKQPEIEVKALRAPTASLHYHEESPIHVTAKDFALAQKAIEHGWSMGKEIDFAKLPTLLT